MVGHRKVIASRHARPISPLPRCHSRFVPLRLEQMVDLEHEFMDRPILCAQTNQSDDKVKSPLKIHGTLSSRLGVYKVTCGDAPSAVPVKISFIDVTYLTLHHTQPS
jgi:hypothetical protein